MDGIIGDMVDLQILGYGTIGAMEGIMVMDGDGTTLGDITDGTTGAGEAMDMGGTVLGAGADMDMVTVYMHHIIIMDTEITTVIMAIPTEVMPTIIHDEATITPIL